MRIYFERFRSLEDVCDGFNISSDEVEGIRVLYAMYDTPAYEGYAQVIFAKDGELYEVNGSHCSCYGLEDQWKPEKTSADALLMRENISDDCKQIIVAYSKNLLGFL